MPRITAEFIRRELIKIAEILEANYQDILPKSHKTKIRNMLDDAPVDWDISYSIVNDRKVKDKSDLKPEDYTQDRDFRDRLKNITIDGRLKDSGKEIRLQIIWGESEGSNKFILKTKDTESSDWKTVTTQVSVNNIKKFINKLNESDIEEDLDVLKDIYKKVLVKEKKEILNFLKNNLNLDYPWKIFFKPRVGKYSLDFILPGFDPESVVEIKEELKEKKADTALMSFIKELVDSRGFSSDAFELKPSFLKKDGFSIYLQLP